jgi:predicted nucleic acid-binding protein
MGKFVLDTYAWIEYFQGSEKGKKVKAIVDYERNEIYTNFVVISEVISKIKRENKNTQEAFEIIVSIANVMPFDENLAKEVGVLHAEIKSRIKDFGLADTFVLLTAKKMNAKILTGDEHFKDFKEAILL